MDLFQTVILTVIGCFFGSVGVGFLIGWKFLPVSERSEKRLATSIKITTAAIIGLAVAMTFAQLVFHAQVLPLWLVAAIGITYVANVGALRGYSVRKTGGRQ